MNSDNRRLIKSSLRRLPALILVVIFCVCMGTGIPSKAQDVPEMLLTSEGLLAMSTPKGWERADGPGMIFFLHKGESQSNAKRWIYVSSAPIGPKEDDKNAEAFIKSDLSGFKERFKKGSVQKLDLIDLPLAKIHAPVYRFQSGEEANAFEQVIYIDEGSRVLVLTLSAATKEILTNTIPDFEQFAKSYRGSVTAGSGKKQ
jgi:hypothetical protein